MRISVPATSVASNSPAIALLLIFSTEIWTILRSASKLSILLPFKCWIDIKSLILVLSSSLVKPRMASSMKSLNMRVFPSGKERINKLNLSRKYKS